MINLPDGPYRAATVRFFTPATRQWSIYWIDGRNPTIDAPMIGGFKNGVGEFYADETFEGKPIRVRFLWSEITAHSCQWAQAFSADGGETWETNWEMRFSRA